MLVRLDQNRVNQQMLEGLEDVSWIDKKTASGNACHVPAAIRGLVSNDPAVQKASYWKLDNHVVLQSDLYDSAPHVVPFLLEILSSGISSGKHYVYDLIHEIANGYAPEEAICDFEGENKSLAATCREVSLRGLDMYFGDIKDQRSDVRVKALELIMSFNEEKEIIVPRLKKLLVKENDRVFCQQLERAINEFEHLPF